MAKKKSVPKLRHELKHTINFLDCFMLRQRLQAVMKKDPHVGKEGKYRIRSLYFDNFEDKALREKINGINRREKFRIRYYNDDYSFIRLEKKSKINGLCMKEGASITKEETEKIIAGEIEWMKEKENPLFMELYAKMQFQQLRPKTIVEYIREPFVYEMGNVRVTLDSEIRTGLCATELFNEQLVTLETSEEPITVLEVKYDEFLPEIIQNIIQMRDRRTSSYSKYVVCRKYI